MRADSLSTARSVWLCDLHADIVRRRSPHSEPRKIAKNSAQVRHIVLHCISLPPGEFATDYIEALFLGNMNEHIHQHPYFERLRDMKVSAHFVVDRQGGIVQYVALDHCAWHAGESQWGGVSQLNAHSIGIELIGDEHTPYEDAQYDSLARLTALLKPYLAYDFRRDDIVRHSDIAPLRKTDPGPSFDLARLASQLPFQ